MGVAGPIALFLHISCEVLQACPSGHRVFVIRYSSDLAGRYATGYANLICVIYVKVMYLTASR